MVEFEETQNGLSKPNRNARQNGLRMINSHSRRMLRLYLYAFADAKCHICQQHMTFKDMSVDHVIPLSRGGKTKLGNLRAAHIQCNNIKGNKHDG